MGFGTGPASLPNLLQHLEFMFIENNLSKNLNGKAWILMGGGHGHIIYNELSFHKVFHERILVRRECKHIK